MKSRAFVAVLVAIALLGAACDDEGTSGTERPSTSPAPSASASAAPVPTPAPPRPQQLVDDPESLLYGTVVRRHGDALDVTTVWACNHNAGACLEHSAIAHSADGFVTVDYTPGGSRRNRAALAPDRPRSAGRYSSCADAAEGTQVCIGGLEDDAITVAWTRDGGSNWSSRDLVPGRNLLAAPVTSLRLATFALQWGGDGATLFPFERVSRSNDSGRTWSTVDVRRPDGVMPYTSGSVIAADGRLITLLDNWSDDRRGKPSNRPHDLYVSNGSDWSSYRPLTSTFRPALHDAPNQWSAIVSLQASASPDPVMWVTTWDKMLYVSTDDGRSFRQIPAR